MSQKNQSDAKFFIKSRLVILRNISALRGDHIYDRFLEKIIHFPNLFLYFFMINNKKNVDDVDLEFFLNNKLEEDFVDDPNFQLWIDGFDKGFLDKKAGNFSSWNYSVYYHTIEKMKTLPIRNNRKEMISKNILLSILLIFSNKKLPSY